MRLNRAGTPSSVAGRFSPNALQPGAPSDDGVKRLYEPRSKDRDPASDERCHSSNAESLGDRHHRGFGTTRLVFRGFMCAWMLTVSTWHTSRLPTLGFVVVRVGSRCSR